MKHPLPTRALPDRPDLDQLKRQAKELLETLRSSERCDESEPQIALHDAQLALARSYGYESWPKLKAYVDGVTIQRLMAAVRENDIEQVRVMVQRRPELINTVEATNREYRPLHYAVFGRMAQMVRTLMELGADPHAGISPQTDATGALTIAIERGYDEIAAIIRETEKLREAGRPTVDQIPEELRHALRAGDEDAVITILQHHRHLILLQMPGNRQTLLHFAAASALERVATWLVEHGANVNARASDGSTPIEVSGSMEIVDLLRARGGELTPRAAVIVGDEEFLRTKHAERSLTDPQDDRGWLLRLAVDWERPEILRLLLDLGFDPDARARVDDVDEIAFTWGMPLYQCVRAGNHAMAELLLERGADPNGQVYASGTPLSEAYGQRDVKMIELLERYGGKSNPSMAGLYRRKDLALRLLAEHGDTALPDDGFGSGPVAEQLLSSGARGGDPDIVQLGLDRVDWPAGDRRWYGALAGPLGFWNHWIGPWCHHEWDRTTYLTCFKMILARCGPPTAQLRFGATALHHVVTTGDHLTVEERGAFATALLDAGARLDQRDELLRSTPLGWACRWGREELVRIFLDRGADPIEADAEPWATPLAWAEKKGHAEIATMLRARARL